MTTHLGRLFIAGLICCLTALPLSSFAQNFDQYQLLTSKGEVPEVLLTPLSEKIDAQAAGHTDYKRKDKEAIARHRFFVDNNYYTDRLMRSGRVLFGDPIGEYMNLIKNYLLRDDPELAQQINVYLVRSPQVNAYATPDGTILVHLGLFAKLPDEATLAFVLSHEIQHFKQQHSIRQFEEIQNLTRSTRIRSDEDLEEFLKAKNLYSRKQELEADRLGLDLFLKSDYTLAAMYQAMDLLAYSFVPFSQHEWDRNLLTGGDYTFPDNYFLDTLTAIDPDEYADDEEDTHPNVGTRRDSLTSAIKGRERASTQTYLFGQEKFETLRKIARFELCQAQLMDGYPVEAIWTASALLKTHPESEYVRNIIAHGFYRIAKHAAWDEFRRVCQRYTRKQGESQQLSHLLNKMTKGEVICAALNYVWALQEQYPDNPMYAEMSTSLAADLISQKHRYLRGNPDVPKAFQDKLPGEGSTRISRRNTSTSDDEVDEDAGTEPEFILADEFRDSTFMQMMDSIVTDLKVDRLLRDAKGLTNDYRGRKRSSKLFKKRLIAGSSVGADKIVFAPVVYRVADMRKPIAYQYNETESAKTDYLQTFEEMADMVNLDIDFLAYEDQESNIMADIGLLNHWVADELGGYEFDGMVNIWQPQMEQLMERYGTEYFGWNGMMRIREKRIAKRWIGGMVLTLPVIYATGPLLLYGMLKPKFSNLYLNVVFNAATGEPELLEFRTIKNRVRPRLLKATLYNTVYQIKNESE